MHQKMYFETNIWKPFHQILPGEPCLIIASFVENPVVQFMLQNQYQLLVANRGNPLDPENNIASFISSEYCNGVFIGSSKSRFSYILKQRLAKSKNWILV